jgi:UDP-glucose 4-epimerase
VIDAAERVTGRSIPRRDAARRAGDPPTLVADARRAKAALGWTPKLSGLDDIIASAWAWHRRN